MEQEKWDRLSREGVDVESALERLMGNCSLLERFLKKFAADRSVYETLEKSLAEKDVKGALAASHSLKGMTANLSMLKLSELFARQVAFFRADRFEEASAMMPEIDDEFHRMIVLIEE